jgi:hypothetical protein
MKYLWLGVSSEPHIAFSAASDCHGDFIAGQKKNS